MEYSSTQNGLKTTECSSQKETCRKIKSVLLSERSQSKKATYFQILIIWLSEKSQHYGDIKKIRLPGTGEQRDK